MTKIACLHAHHSNIKYVDEQLSKYEVVHFVDPALSSVSNSKIVAAKVQEQLEWMLLVEIEAIIISCSYYAAYIPGNFPVPIITLEQLLFDELKDEKYVDLVFTNPKTVDASMENYLKLKNIQQKVTIHIVPNAFQLVMANNLAAYKQRIDDYVEKLPKENVTAFAQLSMEIAKAPYIKTAINLLPGKLEQVLTDNKKRIL